MVNLTMDNKINYLFIIYFIIHDLTNQLKLLVSTNQFLTTSPFYRITITF